MDGRFSRALARLNSTAAARLTDSTGTYSHAGTTVAGLALQVDRNVERAGADGAFVAVPVAITWPRAALAKVSRGGRFIVGAEAFVVEVVIADDGQWLTAACQEAKA